MADTQSPWAGRPRGLATRWSRGDKMNVKTVKSRIQQTLCSLSVYFNVYPAWLEMNQKEDI